jgi:DedD protein
LDSLLKQRLVGASVLVALGVVFWPLIFTQPDIRDPLVLSEMPARPVIDQSPIQPPSDPSEQITAQLPIFEVVPEALQESADNRTVVGDEGDGLRGLEPETSPLEVPIREDLDGGQPLIDDSGLPIFWVLQVATVGRESRAEEIVTALRERGNKAFYSRFMRVDQELFRVQVGPNSDQAYLRSIKESIDTALQVDSQLLRYVQ